MDSLFVVDASSYLYSAYFAIRNMTNSKGESTNALYGFIRSLLKLRKDFNPTHLIAVFDGLNNAKKRVEIYPEYKAHRQSTPQDLRYQIDRAQTFCKLMGIPFLSLPEVEADDVMGSIAHFAEASTKHIYLCSGDKDLCQLVNDQISLLNTYKDNLVIGPQQVEEIHGVPPRLIIDYLAIVGDASDNVPGVPGFGPKTAAKLLQKFGSLDALLADPALISEPKKREVFLQNSALASLSRQLVTLDTSIHVPHEMQFYALAGPTYTELKEFYQSMNFMTLLKELEPQKPIAAKPPEKTTYLLVDDEASFAELLAELSKANSICFETEMTSPSPLKTELVGIGFGIEPTKAWFVPMKGALGHEKVLQGLKPLFENPHLSFYSHHVKLDLHALANEGIEVVTIGFDTLLASYLLNSHSRQHSLEALTLEHFERIKMDISTLLGKGKHSLTMGEIDSAKLCAYSCESVDYTIKMKLLLEKQIEERGLHELFYDLELPLLRVLTSMERYGLFLDVPFLSTLSEFINSQIGSLREDIFAMAGEEFNINSTKQLIPIFEKLNIKTFKKTPKGQLRLDSEVLESIKDKYPIAGKLLEYRGLEKLRSTYVETLPGEINPKTGRIHCTFNQSVAATGRLSCQDPNLQNIPVRSDLGRQIRQAFCPQKEGWSYLASDYSQIELRLLAHFSEDPNLLHAFTNNEDVHAHTASVIFNVPLNEVSKQLRYQAKAVNFGIIYGQQAFGLSQELNIDVKSAAEFIEMYFKRYTRVKDFIEACKEQTRQTGKAVTLTGRERLIPEILSKNGILRAAAERLAVNTPLQGTAADIIKMAMLKLAKLLPFPLQSLTPPQVPGMVLQIHDELIFELPDNHIEGVMEMVRRTMEDVVQLKVPLIVDIVVGKNWKEC
jgi:DNA polymerase I